MFQTTVDMSVVDILEHDITYFPIFGFSILLVDRDLLHYERTTYCFPNYVSQFTVEAYCFADGRCLFKQPRSVIYHWNQYDEQI